MAAVATLLPALAAAAMVGPTLAGADSGQWLMLARAWAGDSVPSYRDASAVPPAAALLVLALHRLLGDPYLAVKGALVVGFALVPLAAFLLGREVFGPFQGLVGALLVGVGQGHFLRLVAFGSLPQLLALAAFGMALAAALRWHRTGSLASGLGLALAAVAIVASHAPTAAAVLPALGLTLTVAALVWPRDADHGLALRHIVARFGALPRAWAPVLPAVAMFAAHAWAKRAAFGPYLSNEAAFHRKGLEVALGHVLRATPHAWAVQAAFLMVALVVLRGGLKLLTSPGASWAPRSRVGTAVQTWWRVPRDEALAPALFLGVPACTLGASMVAFHLIGAGVDFPRILPLMGLPGLLAVGAFLPRGGPLRSPPVVQGGIGHDPRPAARSVDVEASPRRRRRGMRGHATGRITRTQHNPTPHRGEGIKSLGLRHPRSGAAPRQVLTATLLAALLVAPGVPFVLAGERQAVGFYDLDAEADLRDVLAAVDAQVPEGATVWTPIREGKWLEGVTGRAALFSLPAWAIYRPNEWDRRVDADLLEGGTVWATNGRLAVTFQRDPVAVPAPDPLVAVRHRGETTPMVGLRDGGSTLLLTAEGRPAPPQPAPAWALVPLTSLLHRTEAWQRAPHGDGFTVRQQAHGAMPHDPLLDPGQGDAPTTPTVRVLRGTNLAPGADHLSLTFHATVDDNDHRLAPAALELHLQVPFGGWWRSEADGTVLLLHAPGRDAPAPMRVTSDPPLQVLGPGPRSDGEGFAVRVRVPLGATAADESEAARQPEAWQGSQGAPEPGSPQGPSAAARAASATLRFEGHPAGRLGSTFQVRTVEQVLADHDLRWAMFPADERPLAHASLRALGFLPVHTNPTYVLYHRPDPAPADAPALQPPAPASAAPPTSPAAPAPAASPASAAAAAPPPPSPQEAPR